MDEEDKDSPRIVVVGPCAAGKSTLVSILRPKGYNIRSCLQEHSFAPQMWKKFSQAKILIFLDATVTTIAQRQARHDWNQAYLDKQCRRLAHARAHCDLYVSTDDLTRQQVAERVETFLRGGHHEH